VIARALGPVALVGAVLGAQGALAQSACPTDRDLARGVIVGYEQGDTVTLTRRGDGKIVVIEAYADDTPTTQFIGAHGLYLESEVDLVGGRPDEPTRLTIDFGIDTFDLPHPEPGTSFHHKTINIFADGSQRDEEFSVAFGALRKTTLSGCRYDVIPAILRYAWPDEANGMSLEYHYLPRLGAAIIVSSQFDGEPASPITPNQISLRQK